jgi:ATP-dependent helicase/nuclease subunit B
MATIEGHPDFGILEQRLVALVGGARRSDPLQPVAIVAPTGRLLAHLRQVLAAAFPALLNVRFLHHDALAGEAAAAAGVDLPRPLAVHVREAILERLVAEEGGRLAEYVARRPGSAAALRRSIEDLREAGIDPAIRPDGGGRGGAEILALHARYAGALEGLAKGGPGDRAARARAALPHLPAFARRFGLVVHYGAYDLIGVNLDLMRAVDASGADLVFLVPYHPASPAYRHARRFWPGAFDTAPRLQPDDPAAQGRLGRRLAALYDEEAAPAPPDEGACRMFHAQGCAAELREASLRVLALHRDRGVPLHRIAIIARSLEPYAPHLRDLLPRYGLPFVTSAAGPAQADGAVQAALQLTRAVFGDYERQPLMDLLRSGQMLPGGREVWRDAQTWDRLGRECRVARGFSGWTIDLPRSIERMVEDPPEAEDEEARQRRESFVELRRRQARSLAAVVTRMRRAAAPAGRARGWRDWCRAVDALCRSLLRPFRDGGDTSPDPGAMLVLTVLAEMEDLEAAGVPFSGRAALAHFQRALAAESIALDAAAGGADNGGIRVLDTMQARGLRFDAVFLIGFNADLFPRRPRPDPLLPDDLRTALRERTGRPLPLAAEGRDEEHLLLAHMLGAAALELTVSWQRADESGRARVPSLALREVGRLACGAAELEAVETRAERVPNHPLEAALRAAGDFRLLPAAEARAGAALQAADPLRLCGAIDRLPPGPADDGPVLLAGLRMLGITESFAARDLRFDASVGDAAPPPATWSPSRLERLGLCPQQYFFRHALHVDELLEPSEGYDVPLADLGRHVHHVLQVTYRRLLEGGGPAAGGADPAGREAAVLERVWREESAELAALVGERYPLLWETMSRQWQDALRAFLRADLVDLRDGGGEVIGLEDEVRVSIAPGAGRRAIEMRGRFDRIRRTTAGEVVISDYKTSGDPHAHVAMAEVLKGRRLQLPLYVLMAEARLRAAGTADPAARAEILGVGPAFTREDGTWDDEAGRAALEPEKFARHREDFGETLEVLTGLAAAGFFPFNDRHETVCVHCPFIRACRRRQAPAAARLEAAAAGGDYYLLQRKSTRAPTLAQVRAAGGGGAP